ncbi:hypothetical protein LSAT2_025419 [Lamellibrachia satsuma]|nr:hypothetical protein LSAT2_025419 [Lamellibrachia satsuma]
MSSCQPTMDLWMLFGVVLSMIAVAQSIVLANSKELELDTDRLFVCSHLFIGANSLTCITFDVPRSDGKFEDSNGGFLDINGVNKISCTIAGNKCGLFGASSSVKIPYFKGNSFYSLSASLWLKRNAANPWKHMVIIDATMCAHSPILILSQDKHTLIAVVTTSKTTNILIEKTPSQISDFMHVAVTFSANKVDESGQMKLYINGNLAGQTTTQGKILPLPGPMILGSDPDCGGEVDFHGQMESVSFARTELSASDVKMLYNSPGSCIGG